MNDDPRDASMRKLAHDIANLLTAIIGAAEAVLERPGLDPETRDDIEQIREGATRGADLVRHPKPVAAAQTIFVNATIRATARLLAHCLGTKIVLDLDLPEPDHPARVEPSQLDRILLNLLVNARHAMPDGGAVSVRTARATLPVALARVPDTIPAGDYVAISVADTGGGIPPGDLLRIFEAGFSSRHGSGGSGLGLASVREIVRRAGGFVAIESAEGRGTRFDLYFLRTADPPRPTPVAAAPVTRAAGVALLVDDDPFVLQATEHCLRRAGWTIIRANSARAALDALDGSDCDLMISDVAMPGVDGLALTRLVLKQRPDLPVILSSGYMVEAKDADFGDARVDFLTKPYGRAELLAAVARLVG